jgi:hypothetical protein
MGARDVPVLGYPKNLVRGSDFDYSPGCGGLGGGSCGIPADFRYIWWRIYATNFLTKNRQLILQNSYFKSHLDGGAGGGCAHTEGTSVDYDVLLVYQADGGIFTEDDVTARVTIDGAQTLPFEIVFNDSQIPQPTHPSWGGIFYVVLDLYETGRMVRAASTTQVFKTTNYDYDERL